jgi:hypothetical protein
VNAHQPEVRVPCRYGHHPDHAIYVASTISLEGGIEAEKAMVEVVLTGEGDDGAKTRALSYAWAPIFARHAAKDWDLCDEQGNPTPFDVEALLADYSLARLVAEKANELGYGTAVLAPFQELQARPSPTGPTTATTSPQPRQTRSRRGSR